MRPLVHSFFLCLLLSASAAAIPSYAGSFEECQQKEKDAVGLRTCTEAKRNKAANLLRDQNTAALQAVEKIGRDKRDPALAKQFKAQQASHVRVRINTCRKKPTKNEQVGCEADMDFAHIEKLKRYTNNQQD
jgi:hypothetical protein